MSAVSAYLTQEADTAAPPLAAASLLAAASAPPPASPEDMCGNGCGNERDPLYGSGRWCGKYCARSFATAQKPIQGKGRRRACPFCARSYASASNLRRHLQISCAALYLRPNHPILIGMELARPDNPRNQCALCGEAQGSSSRLLRHMRVSCRALMALHPTQPLAAGVYRVLAGPYRWGGAAD